MTSLYTSIHIYQLTYHSQYTEVCNITHMHARACVTESTPTFLQIFYVNKIKPIVFIVVYFDLYIFSIVSCENFSFL